MADISDNGIYAAPEGSDDVSRGKRASGRSDALRYARDNRFVRAVHSFTTGRFKPLFIALVVAAVAVAIYLPLRDYYIAYRSQAILEEQIAIREAYNEELLDEVDSLLTEEGVQDAAREELGMVMEGETPLTVTGLDEDGNAIVVETESADEASSEDDSEDGDGAEDSDAASDDASDSEDTDDDADDDDADADAVATDTASEADETSEDADGSDADSDSGEDDDDDESVTSADIEAAEDAVYENSAWYWKVLDAFFLFDGTSGQAVVSTGE